MFLCLDICKRLCLVYENFPHINVSGTSLDTIANKVERLIPECPVDKPFPATDGHIPKLEHWLWGKGDWPHKKFLQKSLSFLQF